MLMLTAGSSKDFYGSLDPVPLDHSLGLLLLRHLHVLLVFLCLIAQRETAGEAHVYIPGKDP